MRHSSVQVKIWFQNRRMKWRNSKERELLTGGGGHCGQREQQLTLQPSKPDTTSGPTMAFSPQPPPPPPTTTTQDVADYRMMEIARKTLAAAASSS